MAAAEGAAKLTDSQQCELRVARDRVQKKLDTATSENARLSRAAAEKDRVLADARTRVEYLEAALAAAEAECGRLTADAAKACDKHQAETSRAITAEKLLAEARERLLARIIEIDAVRQRVAQANAVTNAAYDRQRQLEDALCLQQTQFEELERSQSKLAEATKVLLQRFRDRERAVVVAEKKIKALVERNAWLEAARDRAGSPNQRGRETPQSKSRGCRGRGASGLGRAGAPPWRLCGTQDGGHAGDAAGALRRLILSDLKARPPSYSWAPSSSTLPPLATHFLK